MSDRDRDETRAPEGARGTVDGLFVSPGGVPKRPVPSAWISAGGVEGDRQRNRRFHGGPMRVVCLYSREVLDALAAEGHPIVPGGAGENVLVRGLPWADVVPGRRLRVGEAEIEVTSFTAPCKHVGPQFADGDFTRISQKLHPGRSRVYARVLRDGLAAPGDPVVLLPG
jgi:MOSC domain-containing protein YiiM